MGGLSTAHAFGTDDSNQGLQHSQESMRLGRSGVKLAVVDTAGAREQRAAYVRYECTIKCINDTPAQIRRFADRVVSCSILLLSSDHIVASVPVRAVDWACLCSPQVRVEK